MAKRTVFDPSRIGQLLEMKGMSHEELGELIGKSGRTIRFYQDGSISPQIADLVTMCDLLHVDLSYFFITTKGPAAATHSTRKSAA